MDTTNAVLAIVVALLGIGLTFLSHYLKTKLAPQQLSAAMDVARTVVQAAEGLGEDMGVSGPEKYAYASKALKDMSKRVGLRLSDAEVGGLIQAALRQFKQFEKALEETTVN